MKKCHPSQEYAGEYLNCEGAKDTSQTRSYKGYREHPPLIAACYPPSSFAPSHPILAIDPGAVHCGFAVFRDGRCAFAEEHRPEVLYDVVERHIDAGVTAVVCEEFRYLAGRTLSGDPLTTVEVIGVLRHLAAQAGVPFVLQSPTIRRAAAAMVLRHGIVLIGSGPHARDAEVHGYYYILRGQAT